MSVTVGPSASAVADRSAGQMDEVLAVSRRKNLMRLGCAGLAAADRLEFVDVVVDDRGAGDRVGRAGAAVARRPHHEVGGADGESVRRVGKVSR